MTVLIVLNTQKMCVGEGVGIILPLFKIAYGTKPITGLVLLLPPIHVLGQEELEKKQLTLLFLLLSKLKEGQQDCS